MSRKFPPAVSSSKTAERQAPQVPRRYLRAVVELPAHYAVDGQTEWHSTVIDNLGGGGVRLRTREDVASGTVLALRFDIEGAPITATARIAMSLFDAAQARFIHGAAFTAIDPTDQEKIVRRVLALQASTENDGPHSPEA